MAITWEIRESNENGTLIEYTDGTHTCYTRLGETSTSSKNRGKLQYDDIDRYLSNNSDTIKKMFAEQDDDDFKDEGIFEL